MDFISLTDELLGTWENDLDDGSGFHAIWGLALDFKNDGTFIYTSWHKGKPSHEAIYFWRRININTIEIMNEDEEWDRIEYTIAKVHGPYNTKLLKLTNNHFVPLNDFPEDFWDYTGPIFMHTK